MIGGKNFFCQTFDNYIQILKFEKLPLVKEMITQLIVFLDYNYFNYYKMMVIDSSKRQVPDGDTKLIQQINFIGNINSNDSWLINIK